MLPVLLVAAAACVVVGPLPGPLARLMWPQLHDSLPCTLQDTHTRCVEPYAINATHACVRVPEALRCLPPRDGAAWLAHRDDAAWSRLVVDDPPPPDPWCRDHDTQWHLAPATPSLHPDTKSHLLRFILWPLLGAYVLGAVVWTLYEPQRARTLLINAS